jgi:hypothetical protein
MADVTEQTPLAAPEQRPKRKGLVAAVAAVSLALAGYATVTAVKRRFMAFSESTVQIRLREDTSYCLGIQDWQVADKRSEVILVAIPAIHPRKGRIIPSVLHTRNTREPSARRKQSATRHATAMNHVKLLVRQLAALRRRAGLVVYRLPEVDLRRRRLVLLVRRLLVG